MPAGNGIGAWTTADADACAREPIHVPGAIQAHGALLVLEPGGLRVLQASDNAAALLGLPAGLESLRRWRPPGLDLAGELEAWEAAGDLTYLRSAEIDGRPFQIVAHRTGQGIVLECEDVTGAADEAPHLIYPRVRSFAAAIEPLHDLTELGTAAARLIRLLTGFDRVLVYRFGETWEGTVIAEDGNGVLPSYLDLRFPESDIPAQARALYVQNRVRIIPDAGYSPIGIAPALNPLDGRPLDLSQSILRSVSPVHLEYMRNMGTGASLSVSLVVEGRLWGLISCHNRLPRRVSPVVRAACDLLGQVLSLQLGAKLREAEAEERIALKRVESELLTCMARGGRWHLALAREPEAWLQLAGATGATVCIDSEILCVGHTPSEACIARLVAWLGEEGMQTEGPHGQGDGELFFTASLPALQPWAEEIADCASGVLAISISQLHPSFIIWFRPEVVRTVTWGGEPRKQGPDEQQRLHPRASFEQWKEQVRLTSAPWRPAEIASVRDFRRSVINFVLRRAEERAALSDELERSNRELEAFSYSVSHDLRAPFRHIVGYSELLRERAAELDDKARHYLDSISEAALSAGRLVDELLHFSRLGRASLTCTLIDMDKLVAEVIRSLEPQISRRSLEWRIARLPVAWGDGALVRQAVLNLVDNAVKYSRDRDPAIVTIEGEDRAEDTFYRVRDNGVGFDMAYVGKLFGVFQRLHRIEEFEGVGIGLALTHRIIDRHGGRVEARGKLGEGAEFTFTLPKRKSETALG